MFKYGDTREDGYVFVGWKNYKGIMEKRISKSCEIFKN